jgi:hypothetical protein
MAEVGDIWYRYEAHHYAPMVDEYENPIGDGRTELVECEFEVIRATPKTVTVRPYFGPGRGLVSADTRRILTTARKMFAHPTKELALGAFLARNARHKQILRSRLHRAETVRVAALRKLEDVR